MSLAAYFSLFSAILIVLLASCFEEVLYVLPELLIDELTELRRGLLAGGRIVIVESDTRGVSVPFGLDNDPFVPWVDCAATFGTCWPFNVTSFGIVVILLLEDTPTKIVWFSFTVKIFDASTVTLLMLFNMVFEFGIEFNGAIEVNCVPLIIWIFWLGGKFVAFVINWAKLFVFCWFIDPLFAKFAFNVLLINVPDTPLFVNWLDEGTERTVIVLIDGNCCKLDVVEESVVGVERVCKFPLLIGMLFEFGKFVKDGVVGVEVVVVVEVGLVPIKTKFDEVLFVLLLKTLLFIGLWLSFLKKIDGLIKN